MTIAEEAMEHADKVLEEKKLQEGDPAPNRFGMGHINVSFNSQINYSNVKPMTFERVEDLEAALKDKPGHIVVWMGNDKFGNIVVLVSRELSDEEINELHEWQGDLERLRNERRMERAKATIAQKEAEAAAEKEQQNLIAEGRTCREHHGALIEDNRKLKSEVQSLRKQLKRESR